MQQDSADQANAGNAEPEPAEKMEREKQAAVPVLPYAGPDGRTLAAIGLGPSELQKELITGKRPVWVYAVAVLYGLIFLAVLVFLCAWLFGGQSEEQVAGAIGLVAVLGSQAGLLFVPLRVASRRPVKRGALWVPLVASGFLAGLLVLGACWALLEQFHGDNTIAVEGAMFLAAVSWIVWAAIFYKMSQRDNPLGIGFKLHRYLIRGSILELLIAVPAHVVVRQRSDCCAGIYTGIGICLGVGVMLVAFGPAILILFFKRCDEIRLPSDRQEKLP